MAEVYLPTYDVGPASGPVVAHRRAGTLADVSSAAQALSTATPAAPENPPRPRVPRWLSALPGVLALAAAITLGWLHYDKFKDVMSFEAFGFAALFAAVPLVPLVALFWWLNRENPERWWALLAALLWGALAATYMSLHLNEWLANLVGDRQVPTARSAVFVAPWTEETTKAVIIFALVIWRRHRFNGAMAGVVIGGLAGLGFAFTENILYFGQLLHLQGDAFFSWQGFQQIFWWRAVRTSYVHPMFTMATGLGVGIAVRHRNVGVRILAPAVGFSVAALLHMGYNSVASLSVTTDSLNAAYIFILIPTLVASIAAVVFARRIERRAIAARLGDYASFGWLPLHQVPYIADPAGRRTARRHVRRMGKPQRNALREFQRCGLQLGVLRDRMVRGVADARERGEEHRLIRQLRALRAKTVLPGKPASSVAGPVTVGSSW